jgi:hypothetical protein
MAISLFIVVQRIYPIRYEYERLAKIGVATAVSFLLSYITPLKLTILLLFFIFLLSLRFLTKEETKLIREFLKIKARG